VAFGPASDPNPISPPRNTEALLPEVRRVAERLVERLRQAEKLTHAWSDERLTDMLVEAALSECLRALAKTGCWGEANRLPSGELWRIAGSILEVGTLQRHARFKPRGYAGDYQMLARICEQDLCEHPLGRAFDRFFQREAAPRAVRSRTEKIAASLVEHCLQHQGPVYQAVSVGSGPAIDIRRAVETLPEKKRHQMHVRLLDIDPEALDDARARLERLLAPGALTCLRENLPRLAQRRDLDRPLGTPDFLVCSGLFDYLADEAAAALLGSFWRQLAPGGRLLVGNFAPHNPSRAYMEWLGNWYLLYRTAAAMERLAQEAGIPAAHVAIGAEQVGIDLFVIATKPAA
jgi:extracellular factor (EF) 3-hydroxypalmitic acid methyl ester biosynthesis protein